MAGVSGFIVTGSQGSYKAGVELILVRSRTAVSITLDSMWLSNKRALLFGVYMGTYDFWRFDLNSV